MVETADVVEIHERIIKETGGNSGIISYGNIDFVVNQANTSRDVFTQAARMLSGLIRNHGFVDGNKRTAFISTVALLHEKNLEFKVSEGEIWNMIHNIVSEKVKLPEVIKWIKESVKKI